MAGGKPPGTRIMPQKVATPEVYAWAKEVVGNPKDYPFDSENVRLFGDKLLMARVEHHTWSTRGQQHMDGDPNERVSGNFRGATFYEIIDPDAYGTYFYNKMQAAGIAGEGDSG